MAKEKDIAVIGRYWNNPQIFVKFSYQGVFIEISQEDLVTAIVEEIGNPTLNFTKKGIREKVASCLNKIKESTKVDR